MLKRNVSRPSLVLGGLFLLAFIARAWLLYVLNSPFSLGLWLASLLFVLIIAVLTWLGAGRLAAHASLSERGEERFMVMSTLGSLMIPLPFVAYESIGWRGETAFRSLVQPFFTTYISLSPLYIATIVIIISAFLLVAGACALPLWARHSLITRICRLTLLPLVYCLGSLLLALAFNSEPTLVRIFLVLFGLGFPFVLATLFTIPYMLTQWREEQKKPQKPVQRVVFHVAMLIIVASYFCAQLILYLTVDGIRF